MVRDPQEGNAEPALIREQAFGEALEERMLAMLESTGAALRPPFPRQRGPVARQRKPRHGAVACPCRLRETAAY